MLLGLAVPTSGSANLLGTPLGDRAALARIGFLPEHFRFQEWLTAGEFLEMHGQLYGMRPADLRSRLEELLERVGLSDFRHKQLRTFSKGMLQRIGLAQALLNRLCWFAWMNPPRVLTRSAAAWCATSSTNCAPRVRACS